MAHTDCVLCKVGAEVLCMYYNLLIESVSACFCVFCSPIKQRYVTIVYVMSMLSNNNRGIWFSILSSYELSKYNGIANNKIQLVISVNWYKFRHRCTNLREFI